MVYPDAPWCWNIYLHNWAIFGVNVGVHIPAPWSIWDKWHSIPMTFQFHPINRSCVSEMVAGMETSGDGEVLWNGKDTEDPLTGTCLVLKYVAARRKGWIASSVKTDSGWWFGNVWNMNFMTFHILGMSSSQLTNSIIFQRGGEKPPTRWFRGCFSMGNHWKSQNSMVLFFQAMFEYGVYSTWITLW